MCKYNGGVFVVDGFKEVANIVTGLADGSLRGDISDTAISSMPDPAAGWLDMRENSNGIAGGGLGSKIGTCINKITIDGNTP